MSTDHTPTCHNFDLPLKTNRLVLRELRRDDFDDLFVLCTHPEICRYIRPPMRAAEVREHIENRLRPWHFNDGTWVSLAVQKPDEPWVFGEVVFRMESRLDRRAEIGFRFHPDAQGKGYAFEAVHTTAAYIVEALDLHKLIAYRDADNAASDKLLAKLGMRQEGHLRDHLFQWGGWRDTVVHACLHDELRSRKD